MTTVRAGAPLMLTYLVVPLFFMADYVASEETLAAGVKGYQQRAEAVRKRAISELEDQLRLQTASINSARKATVDPKLVGTAGSAGIRRGDKWIFATAEDRANQIRALS